MKKLFFLLYGVTSYAVFFATFLYLLAFTGNYFVPISVDVGQDGPATLALFGNLFWILLFGLQHTVMARPGFKEAWTKIVPKPIERATYCFLSSFALIGMMYFWTPITGTLWSVTDPIGAGILHALFVAGVLIVLLSTFIIDHFELFGLKQVFLNALDKVPAPYKFQVKLLYRLCRHPLMLGWIIMFWAAPVMSLGHALLALGMTAYILVALVYEERDLEDYFGEDYRQYKREVPKLVPFTKSAQAKTATQAA